MMRFMKVTGLMCSHLWCRNQAELWGNVCKIKTFSFCFSRQQGLKLTQSLPTLLSSSPVHSSTPGSWRRVREPREAILPTSSCPPHPPRLPQTPIPSCQTFYPRVMIPASLLSSFSPTDTSGCWRPTSESWQKQRGGVLTFIRVHLPPPGADWSVCPSVLWCFTRDREHLRSGTEPATPPALTLNTSWGTEALKVSTCQL